MIPILGYLLYLECNLFYILREMCLLCYSCIGHTSSDAFLILRKVCDHCVNNSWLWDLIPFYPIVLAFCMFSTQLFIHSLTSYLLCHVQTTICPVLFLYVSTSFLQMCWLLAVFKIVCTTVYDTTQFSVTVLIHTWEKKMFKTMFGD